MNHHDADIAQVVVVLTRECEDKLEEAVAELKEAGLKVESVGADNGVVEGTIDLGLLDALRKLAVVSTTRIVMTYVADYPPGDPRNLDPDDE